jgi:hypothetical protein
LKGSRYGTIVVDLERHEVVDVIHDRSTKTMTVWLEKNPTSVRSGRQAGCSVGTASRRPLPLDPEPAPGDRTAVELQ